MKLRSMKFNVQHSTMSSVLPFEIIAQIIDNVGENEDTNLLKELALVSHSFLHICTKHLFATVELHDGIPERRASSKKGFVKLLTSRPDVVKYIRKLTYNTGRNNDDHLLLPILPNFLRRISNLNCLTICAPLDWNTLNSSLTSALLHLMHLPTINHIDLSFILNFPPSTSSVNLRRLSIVCLGLNPLEEDDSPDIVVQTEMPKIREFFTLDSPLLITKLLRAKWQDGRPAFNFMDLRQLTICLEDEWNIRYLLRKAKLLEKLHLSVEEDRSLEGLHDILSYSARTLEVLDLTVRASLPLGVLCEELEAMAGHNVLEALSLELNVEGYESESEVFIGSTLQKVEKVLVEPGWSALRQVSFQVPISKCVKSSVDIVKLSEALQSLPDKYLSHLPKLESVTFNYSAYLA